MNDDILKGNELIAKFMKHTGRNSLAIEFQKMQGLPEKNYHNSWDWLIPVTTKIASEDWSSVNIHYGTGCTDSFAWCTIDYKVVNLSYNTPQELNSDEQDLLRATWSSVVDFIKWYNKNYYV